jgi:uncharacterized protein YegL
MARFVQDDMDTMNIPGAGNFQFSAVRLDPIKAASEYTLVSIVLDISGSVEDYATALKQTVQTIVEACKKSPRAENLMIRLLTFNDDVKEIHGFKLLNQIDSANYQNFRPQGMTALFDAVFSAIGATTTLSKSLIDQEYDCNGAIYIITDGMDNRSVNTTASIREKVNEAKMQETIESLVTVLVGITPDKQISSYLETFKNEAGLNAYVDMGEATPGKLAKLAQFVSKSISSQSQSLGSGAASNQSLLF